MIRENVSSMASSSAYSWKCNLLESDNNRGVTFHAFGTCNSDDFLPVNAFQISVWCSTERSNIEYTYDATLRSPNR